MKRIIYTNADGLVAFVAPTPEQIEKSGSEQEAVRYVLDHDVPSDAADVTVVHESELPPNPPPFGRFRAAWRIQDGRCVEDLAECRKIHRARLRAAVIRRLAVLRALRQEAEEDGQTLRLANLRQRAKSLRDWVESVDLEVARTPDELETITHAEIDADQEPQP